MAARPLPAGEKRKPLPQHIAGLVRAAVPPMHPAGRKFVAIPLVFALALWRRPIGLAASLAAAGAVGLFFREPVRVAPDQEGAVVSPADGTVSLVDQAIPPVELGMGAEPLPRVSIFLSILDVHVQRSPVTGQVAGIAYTPGEFRPADVVEASEVNERNCLRLRMADGTDIGVVQIAGLVARRIVCEVDEGDELTLGQTYGLIRFGSRVDTYLPLGTVPTVKVGQHMVGGETVLATLVQG